MCPPTFFYILKGFVPQSNHLESCDPWLTWIVWVTDSRGAYRWLPLWYFTPDPDMKFISVRMSMLSTIFCNDNVLIFSVRKQIRIHHASNSINSTADVKKINDSFELDLALSKSKSSRQFLIFTDNSLPSTLYYVTINWTVAWNNYYRYIFADKQKKHNTINYQLFTVNLLTVINNSHLSAKLGVICILDSRKCHFVKSLISLP